ncbi:MAG: tetratricopeptide repeat protein [Micropepsaceae bacterium]
MTGSRLMRRVPGVVSRFLMLAFVVACASTVSDSHADDKRIDRMDYTQVDGRQTFVVHFNAPVTYLSHAPVNEGSVLQVYVRALRNSGQPAVVGTKERISVSGGSVLTDASYEDVSATQARLTFIFSSSVKYRVVPGGDTRSIEVSVAAGAAGASRAAAPEVVIEAPPPNPTLSEPVPETSLPEGDLAKTMTDARAALERGDNEAAIRLLTKVLASAGNESARPEALEMLGVARERNKQVAHAKAEYEEYLRLYPEGEGASRVKQRLAGLVAAASKPHAKLRELSRGSSDGNGSAEYFYHGSLSQSLRRDQDMSADVVGDGVNQFDFDTDVDTTLGYSDEDISISLRANGGYVLDLSQNSDNSEGRLSTLFLEIGDAHKDIYARFGRQTRSSDGVLGRFDGGMISAALIDEIRLNVIGGMPVDSSRDLEINTHRYFGAVGLDLGPIFDDWHANIYAIDQKTYDITDRQAVGGEVRFAQSDMTVFGLVDYDVSYNEVNIALLSGNYFFPDQSTFNFSVDYRTSPILTTTSALQGQPVTTIEDLLTLFTEDQVRQLALDRTATMSSASVGASHPFSDQLQLSVDAMITDISGTIASGGVDAAPRTGMEYYYGIQLTGTGLFAEEDIAALGLRYADQDQFNRVTADLNTRYSVGEFWKLNPRLRSDYKWNDNDAGTEFSIKPSVRTNYRAFDNWDLELELGGEWRQTETTITTDDHLGYFAYMTYRLDF